MLQNSVLTEYVFLHNYCELHKLTLIPLHWFTSTSNPV